MRLALFTDTLGDINGVSRFIRNIAEQSERRGRELRVIASTRFEVPGRANLLNFPPVAAARIPRYPQLELTIPPRAAITRRLAVFCPDAVHISTPGPVGMLGRCYAMRHRLPLLGTYHTDFPAYIEHLFDDPALTRAAAGFMRWFYRPFDRIFTRSEAYASALAGLGIPRGRMLRLRPGVATARFAPAFRDEGVWRRIAGEDSARSALAAQGLTVLYVGRISIEKNLPMLAEAWRRVREKRIEGGPRARLVVVGDGPYRSRMERELADEGSGRLPAFFLGFRDGAELSAIYASSDLFVFPSATDTLGQVVMEAQCSGLPTLVSDRGGPREMIRDGESGHALPADDPDRWAETIIRLLNDGSDRARMASAAVKCMSCRDIADSFEHFWSVHEDAVHSARERAGG